jgi:hypothetical protein
MKAKINNVLGTYNIVGNNLIHIVSNRKLLITERQNITEKKALNFLLDKTEGKGTYISSLYNVSTISEVPMFVFDYNGLKLRLELNKAINTAYIVNYEDSVF